MVWAIGMDPTDDTGCRRIMVPAKNNIIETPTGLAFTMENSSVRWSNVTVTTTADQMVAAAADAGTVGHSALEDAKEFLRVELAHGPRPVKELVAAAVDAQISERT